MCMHLTLRTCTFTCLYLSATPSLLSWTVTAVDEGAKCFAGALHNNDALCVLDLQQNLITEDGVTYLRWDICVSLCTLSTHVIRNLWNWFSHSLLNSVSLSFFIASHTQQLYQREQNYRIDQSSWEFHRLPIHGSLATRPPISERAAGFDRNGFGECGGLAQGKGRMKNFKWHAVLFVWDC